MDLAVAGQLVPIRPISQLNVKGQWGEVWEKKTTEILKKYFIMEATNTGQSQLKQGSEDTAKIHCTTFSKKDLPYLKVLGQREMHMHPRHYIFWELHVKEKSCVNG